MSRYPALVEALQGQRALRMSHLVRLDFASETKRVWPEFGPFRDLDGNIWSGLGELGSISDIDRALVSSGSSTSPATLSLSGVADDLVEKTLAAPTEVKGRPARIFEQYFDLETSQPVERPIPLYVGLMDRMVIRDEGPTLSTITVTLVTLLYRRRRSPAAYLSASSQERRFPGDLGLEQISALVQFDDTKWPGYS